jgi:DNA-directed RNA polymerase subunit RPC12/RpoP
MTPAPTSPPGLDAGPCRELLVVLAGSGPLTDQDLATRLGQPPSSIRILLLELVGRDLVRRSGEGPRARYATLWKPATPPPLTEEAAEFAADLEPPAPGDPTLVECPRCPARHMAVALGWKLAGGRRRLVYRCGRCGAQFFATPTEAEP